MMTMTYPQTLATRARDAFKRRSYRLRMRLERAARAWRYLRGKMTDTDAHHLVWEAEHVSGCYSLEGFTVDSVLEDARELFGDVPGLERWAVDACARVASKWDASGDVSSAAAEWAMSLIAQYAKSDGVNLVERED